MRATLPLLAALVLASGCAFVPHHNLRLDEARQAYAEALADPAVRAFAPAEMAAAAEALQRAATARDTLDDPAIIDHLSYVARQRVAIGRETARLRAFDRATTIRQ